jgi:hypothetical protein
MSLPSQELNVNGNVNNARNPSTNSKAGWVEEENPSFSFSNEDLSACFASDFTVTEDEVEDEPSSKAPAVLNNATGDDDDFTFPDEDDEDFLVNSLIFDSVDEHEFSTSFSSELEGKIENHHNHAHPQPNPNVPNPGFPSKKPKHGL